MSQLLCINNVFISAPILLEASVDIPSPIFMKNYLQYAVLIAGYVDDNCAPEAERHRTVKLKLHVLFHNACTRMYAIHDSWLGRWVLKICCSWHMF